MTTRNRIPDVKPLESSNGTWILRFNFKGKQQYLSLGKGKSAYALGLTLSERIKSDIALGQYEGISQYAPKPVPQSPIANDKPVEKGIDYIGIIERFIEHLEGNGYSSKHIQTYQTIARGLKKHSDSLTDYLLSLPSQDTIRRYTGKIKSAFNALGVNVPDELVKVKTKKNSNKSVSLTDDVFTKEEMDRILEWFKESREYSHYLPMVKFRFLTAVRPCEVIALQWEDIDFQNNRVTIKRSWTEQDGMKGRKNGEETYLPLNESLRGLLEAQRGLHKSLVFPSPKGTYIRLVGFNRRAWKSCKQGTGINKRFYAIRHTVLSHLVQDQGLATAAYVAGHKSLEMVNRHYGKLLNVPVLPEF